MDLLSATRAAAAILMLAGGALQDLRSRRVPNGYWTPFAALAAALLAVDVQLHAAAPALLAWPLALACAVAGLAYLLWRLRLFGGADAKCLMVLAFLAPQAPPTALGFGMPFALDAFVDGTVATLLVPVGVLAWNLAHGRIRLPAALLGTPMPIGTARAAHVWPMQEAGPDGAIRWRYWADIRMDTGPVYDGLEAAGLRTVWATAKVPALALWTVGAVVALLEPGLLLRAAAAFAGR